MNIFQVAHYLGITHITLLNFVWLTIWAGTIIHFVRVIDKLEKSKE